MNEKIKEEEIKIITPEPPRVDREALKKSIEEKKKITEQQTTVHK